MQNLNIPLHLALANALYTNTALYQGISIDRYFNGPKTGYMYSGFTPGITYPNISSVNAHELSAWIKENLESSQERIYFGGWINEKTGEVCFDISKNIESGGLAIQYAINFRQSAIWDVINKKQIWVEGIPKTK